MTEIWSGRKIGPTAARAGMDEKTARKYVRLGKLPSEVAAPHTWRTREDPFAGLWEEIRSLLEINAGLEGKTLFEYMQRKYPGQFADGQLRTLQRRIKVWRATEGPDKEVFFAQVYRPGVQCQSDFKNMNEAGVTIAGQRFDHLLYHFVLPYSNWEYVQVCFAECFESLSTGLQGALWELGGVPEWHSTDRLTPAVNNMLTPAEFTARYEALMRHYGMQGRKIQTGRPNENGDVEQRHYRFVRAVLQSLMLRGSSDFESRSAYEAFLRNIEAQVNAGRHKRLCEERAVLSPLPAGRLEAYSRLCVRVGQGSTIQVKKNTYSVWSRLIGEWVDVRVHSERVEVWYAQQKVETMPRLRGSGKHYLQYRHIIDWLVRKPGAFENYRYRDDLFPSTRFRMAYDALRDRHAANLASREYLKILQLAARQSESGVEDALRRLMEAGERVHVDSVRSLLVAGNPPQVPTDVSVDPVDLSAYDGLLNAGAAQPCLPGIGETETALVGPVVQAGGMGR